jgi:hypothetical protein
MIYKRFHHKAPYTNKTLATRITGFSFINVCAKERGGEIIRLRGSVGCVCHGVLLNLIDRFGQADRNKKMESDLAFPPTLIFEFD